MLKNLDTDIINSIIAQTEKGLVQSLSDEEVSTETETDSLNASIKGTGTIGGSIVKLAKAEAIYNNCDAMIDISGYNHICIYENNLFKLGQSPHIEFVESIVPVRSPCK